MVEFYESVSNFDELLEKILEGVTLASSYAKLLNFDQ